MEEEFILTDPTDPKNKIKVKIKDGVGPTEAELQVLFKASRQNKLASEPTAPTAPDKVDKPKVAVPPVKKPAPAPVAPEAPVKPQGLPLDQRQPVRFGLPSMPSLAQGQPKEDIVDFGRMSARTLDVLPKRPQVPAPPPKPTAVEIDDYKSKWLVAENANSIPHKILRAYIDAKPENKEQVIARISPVGKQAIREIAKDPVYAYVQRWLTSATPQSTPYKKFIEYATAPEGMQDKVLKGLSPTGQQAIKTLYQSMIDGQNAQEREEYAALIQDMDKVAKAYETPQIGEFSGADVMALQAGITKGIPLIARYMDKGATQMMRSRVERTAGGFDVFSPEFSDVLALGYDPAGALLPPSGTGAGGAARSMVSNMFLRPSSMAANVAMQGAFTLGAKALGAGAVALANSQRVAKMASTPLGNAVLKSAPVTANVALRGALPATALIPGIKERDWERLAGEIPIVFGAEALVLGGYLRNIAASRAYNTQRIANSVGTDVPRTKFRLDLLMAPEPPTSVTTTVGDDPAQIASRIERLTGTRDRMMSLYARIKRGENPQQQNPNLVLAAISDITDELRRLEEIAGRPRGMAGLAAAEARIPAGAAPEQPAGVLTPDEMLGLYGGGRPAVPVEPPVAEPTQVTETGGVRAGVTVVPEAPPAEAPATATGTGASTAEFTPSAPEVPAVETPPAPSAPEVPPSEPPAAGETGRGFGRDGLVSRIQRRFTEYQAVSRFGLETPSREGLHEGIVKEVDDIIADPARVDALLDEAARDPNSVTFRHQVAASMKEQQLEVEFDQVMRDAAAARSVADEARARGDVQSEQAALALAVEKETQAARIANEAGDYINLITRVNSNAGTILWLQGAFKRSVDFSQPNAKGAVMSASRTMLLNSGVPKEIADASLANVRVLATHGENAYRRVVKTIEDRAAAADESTSASAPTTAVRRTTGGPKAERKRLVTPEQREADIARLRELWGQTKRVGIVPDQAAEAERNVEMVRLAARVMVSYIEDGINQFRLLGEAVRGAIGDVPDGFISDAYIKAKAEILAARRATQEGQEEEVLERAFAMSLIRGLGGADRAENFVDAIRDIDGRPTILYKLVNGEKLTTQESELVTQTWNSNVLRGVRGAAGEQTPYGYFHEVRKQVQKDATAARKAAEKAQRNSLDGVKKRVAGMLDNIVRTDRASATAAMGAEARAFYEAGRTFKRNVQNIVKQYNGFASIADIETIVKTAGRDYVADPANAEKILDTVRASLQTAGGVEAQKNAFVRQLRSIPGIGNKAQDFFDSLPASVQETLATGATLRSDELLRVAEKYNEFYEAPPRRIPGAPASALEQVRVSARNIRNEAKRDAAAVQAEINRRERQRIASTTAEIKRRTDKSLDELNKPKPAGATTTFVPEAEGAQYRAGARALRKHIDTLLNRYKGTVDPDVADQLVADAVQSYKDNPAALTDIKNTFTSGVQSAGGGNAKRLDIVRELKPVLGDNAEAMFDGLPDSVQARLLAGDALTDAEAALVGDAYLAARPPRQTPVTRQGAAASVVEAGKAAAQRARQDAAVQRRADKLSSVLGFLQSRYGNARGEVIYNNASDSLKAALNDPTLWTQFDTDEFADLLVMTKPGARVQAGGLDPRVSVIQNAAKKARDMTRPVKTQAEVDTAAQQRADAILERLKLGKVKDPVTGQSRNPVVDQAVKAYLDGARSLERMREWAKTKYGDRLTEDEINTIFSEAAKEYETQARPLNELRGMIGESLATALWDTKSAGEKWRARLAASASIYKMMALSFDAGVILTQFGPFGISRPGFAAYGSVPTEKDRGTLTKLLRSFTGGAPGSGADPIMLAAWKAFRSETAYNEAMANIRQAGAARHGNPDIYFETYRLDPTDPMSPRVEGFNLLPEDTTGTFAGERLAVTRQEIPSEMLLRDFPVLKVVHPLLQQFIRGTDVLINHHKVALFEQMFMPFEHLAGDQRVQAGRAVSSFVNTLSGMGRYDDRGMLERGIRNMSGMFTAPRFYVSNIEVTAPQVAGIRIGETIAQLGGMSPAQVGAAGTIGQAVGAMTTAIRPLLVSRNLPLKAAATGTAVPPLPVSEQLRIARVISSEYVRIVAGMTAVNMALRAKGIGYVVTDRDDPRFGNAVIKVSPTAEKVIPLLGQTTAWIRDLTQLTSGRQKNVEGEYEPVGYKNKLAIIGFNKMSAPYGAIGSLIMPSEGTGDVRTNEYTLPGGETITWSEPGQAAFATGKQFIPAPILVKTQFEMIGEYVRNREADNLNYMMTHKVADMLMNYFGAMAKTQLSPEALRELKKDKDYKEAGPAGKRMAREIILYSR